MAKRDRPGERGEPVIAVPGPEETNESYLLLQRDKALSEVEEAEESGDRDAQAAARARVQALQERMRKLGFD
jgi:hypothetical protein